MEVEGKPGVDVQLKFPMIIAVKGHSCTEKSTVACKLADLLKYPLINQDDFTSALQSSLPIPTSSTKAIAATKHLDNLSFETVCKITSTQLPLKISVIINTPLSHPTHLDRLVQLASSTGARLIIIECKPQGEQDGYDVGQVPKLIVDTTKPLVVEDLVSAMLRVASAVDLHSRVDEVLEGNLTKSFSLKPSQDKVQTEFGRHQMATEEFYKHLHALTFTSEPRNGSGLSCKRCQELISGPAYQCVECEKFILHKSCAESPMELDLLRQQVPTYLREIKSEYNFPETQRCQICEDQNKDFSYDCYDCLLQTHLKCGFLPTVLKHEGHKHLLNLVIMPVTYNFEYQCCACGDFGKSISCKCYDCNSDFHVNCVLLPHTIKCKPHSHPLNLTYYKPEGYDDDDDDDDDDDEYYCDDCWEQINPDHWVYYCAKCLFVAHISCATGQLRGT